MARWVPIAKPAAELTAVGERPELREDGSQVFLFVTATGVRFAKVVEEHGYITWWQQVVE